MKKTIFIADLIASYFTGNSQNFNNAILLNGSTDYITIPDNSNLDQTTTITVEARINLCDTSSLHDIVSKNWCTGSQNAYTFRVRGGKLEWVWDNNTCADGGNAFQSNDQVILENTWYHVAVVHTTSSVTLYVDGVPVAGSLVVGNYGSILNSNQPLLIGAYRGGSGGYFYHFEGLMDEVRVWNYDVSSTNILANYNTELTGSEAGLVLYCDMNTASASGNNITVTNQANLTGSTLNGTTLGTATTPRFISYNSTCNGEVLSINETNSSYSVYPNPTNGNLFINFNKVESDVKIKILNSIGQAVYTKNFSSTDKVSIDFESPKGIYFLLITTNENKISSTQIIKY